MAYKLIHPNDDTQKLQLVVQTLTWHSTYWTNQSKLNKVSKVFKPTNRNKY